MSEDDGRLIEAHSPGKKAMSPDSNGDSSRPKKAPPKPSDSKPKATEPKKD